MAYNTKPIVTDKDGNPISQYYNPDTDSYEPVEGSHGANKVLVENNELSLIPILDKLSQLTGTVVDEETRKSNELERIDNEDTRQSNEADRVSSELARESNENTRKTQESDRVNAESSRVIAESGRVTAENTRVSNEDVRKSNEIARESSEATRISNEDTRKFNESSRQSSETIRNTNEDARIDNEDTRKSNELERIDNELAREASEGVRELQELGRVSAENDRVSAEISRESAESTRVSQENTRQSQESIRESNEGVRESQESIRESNEALRIALYDDLLSKVASGFFKGEKGDTGNGLEYTWNGTQLGVRVEGTTEYVYVDLKGDKGDTGDIANLTMQHVINALGYTPANEDGIVNLQDDLDAHKAENASQDNVHGLRGEKVVIGRNSNADDEGFIAIGDGAEATANQLSSIAIGKNAKTDSFGGRTVVIGENATAGGRSVAIGHDSQANNNSGIAIGFNAKITTMNSDTQAIAIGRDSLISAGSWSIALGKGAESSANYSAAIGNNAVTSNNTEGVLGAVGSNRTSKWIVPGDFTVNGTKNFEMPHPKPEKKATHRIRHGAVESPTPGDTLYRYKITATKENDMQVINLPDYFIHLNKDVQIFVTPQGHFGNGYGVLNKETEQLEISCQLEGEYNVLVIGTRNDDHQSVQDWDIKGVEREIGESWTGETYAFSVNEIIEIEEIKEESI